MTVKVCIFDAYGTLFDVSAAARACAAEPGREAFAARWAQVAEIWRIKQLQYSWLLAAAGRHEDFWAVTQNALDFALEAHGLAEPHLRERLLQLYWELEAYPEVPAMLAALKTQGLRTSILSNGSPKMLDGAVSHAGLGALLDDVLSAQSAGAFKPHPSVYALCGARFGCAAVEMAFVSSNGWDAAAASGHGFRAIWVNRKAEPVDRLWATPQTILHDLTPAPDVIAEING